MSVASHVAFCHSIRAPLATQLDTTQGQTLFDQACTMCKTLELKIKAEGVKTQTQYDYVVRSGVDMVQSCYFSKALAWHDAMAFYQAREQATDAPN